LNFLALLREQQHKYSGIWFDSRILGTGTPTSIPQMRSV